MFTGLVEELGRIKSIAKGGRSLRLSIHAHKVLEEARIGDSIAVNGACLTVVELGDSWFTVDVMAETVDRTGMLSLKPGDAVNLERALRVGDRLGGHIVSGHIDGVGVIEDMKPSEIAILITIRAGADVMRYIVEKGSIAVDGISLTIAECGADWFLVSVIPHTAAETTLGRKKPGAAVNLEGDIIGKYVEKLLQPAPGSATSERVNLQFLKENGFY